MVSPSFASVVLEAVFTMVRAAPALMVSTVSVSLPVTSLPLGSLPVASARLSTLPLIMSDSVMV